MSTADGLVPERNGGNATRRTGDQDSPPAANRLGYSIDIQGLTKSFQRRSGGQRNGYTTLKSALLGLFRGKTQGSAGTVTNAVADLTLRIPAGASVGIIGGTARESRPS